MRQNRRRRRSDFRRGVGGGTAGKEEALGGGAGKTQPGAPAGASPPRGAAEPPRPRPPPPQSAPQRGPEVVEVRRRRPHPDWAPLCVRQRLPRLGRNRRSYPSGTAVRPRCSEVSLASGERPAEPLRSGRSRTYCRGVEWSVLSNLQMRTSGPCRSA